MKQSKEIKKMVLTSNEHFFIGIYSKIPLNILYNKLNRTRKIHLIKSKKKKEYEFIKILYYVFIIILMVISCIRK